MSVHNIYIATPTDMPTLYSANGDHLPDIFAISENRKRALWLSRGERCVHADMFCTAKCSSTVLTCVCYCSHSFDMLLLNQSGVATLVEEGSVVHAEFVDINSDCLSGTLCVHGTRNYVVSSLL